MTIPTYNVLYTLLVIATGLTFFQEYLGFNDPLSIGIFSVGIVIALVGVVLINARRRPEHLHHPTNGDAELPAKQNPSSNELNLDLNPADSETSNVRTNEMVSLSAAKDEGAQLPGLLDVYADAEGKKTQNGGARSRFSSNMAHRRRSFTIRRDLSLEDGSTSSGDSHRRLRQSSSAADVLLS